ncbi:MAG: hypothetical protein DRO23_03015 [Thermoprotei archaeon]|nr:MAG: hypothetical protein DRO23_03015 [Thermoprotei archaeon]
MKHTLAMYYTIAKNFIRGLWEEFLALTIATSGNFVTGTIFGLGSRIISAKPSVLIVAPATMAMRGNIYSSLGSRLGSLLHLGHIEPRISKNPILIDNINSVLTQTVLMGTYLGIISSILYFILAGKIEFADLTFITSLTGLLALPLMLLVTFGVTFLTYLKGLDPDNFSVPIITFTGDAISLPLLLTSTYIVLKSTFEVKWTFIIFLILFLMFLIIRIIVQGRKYLKKIIYESFPVLALCGFLEMIAGLALIVNVERILKTAGILTIVPGFLEDGGAIGGILAAKISTKLHLGDIEPRIVPSKIVVEEFCKAYFLSLIMFPIIGVYGYLISSILSLNVPPFTTLIVVTLTSGFILTFFISLLVYLISIVSFKKGVDPDNVTIPIVTSTIDAIGMFILVYVLLFFYRI